MVLRLQRLPVVWLGFALQVTLRIGMDVSTVLLWHGLAVVHSTSPNSPHHTTTSHHITWPQNQPHRTITSHHSHITSHSIASRHITSHQLKWHHIHHIAFYTPLPRRDGKQEKQLGGLNCCRNCFRNKRKPSLQKCSFNIATCPNVSSEYAGWCMVLNMDSFKFIGWDFLGIWSELPQLQNSQVKEFCRPCVQLAHKCYVQFHLWLPLKSHSGVSSSVRGWYFVICSGTPVPTTKGLTWLWTKRRRCLSN